MHTQSTHPNFIRAAVAYFGLLPGQTLGGFATDLMDMSYADRRDIAEMLRAEGVQFPGVF